MFKKIFFKLRKLLFYNRFIGNSEYRIKKFVREISKQVPAKSTVLDAGAGQCQYKPFFRHGKYTSQDLCIGDKGWDFGKIDIKSEIYSIPVKSASFDYILCIEVLEHLKYPHLAFKEFSRILKFGGKLFVVCPLVWFEHQKPHDYFRYTQFALRMLAEENSFAVESINKQGGKFICLTQVITEIFPSFFIERNMVLVGYIFKVLFYPINFLIAFVFYFLDKLDKEKDLTPQYECIFKKK